MKRFLLALVALLTLPTLLQAQDRTVKIKLIETTDVHGCFFPYDFINRRTVGGSMARIHTYVQQQRDLYRDDVILVDNGDILQGQPTAYYYNYIDTTTVHLVSDMLNFMGYNAGNFGNHDIETGNAVFERWVSDCAFPVLGANIIDTKTGQPHFQPYEIIVRDGVKVAVLGMITPAIPVWLSENLWKGLRFDDMEQTARKWIPIIQQTEHPDVIVGLFHSGKDAEWLGNGKYREQASVEVAERVPGFDVVLMGHDHARECRKVTNVEGREVLVINPANRAFNVADVEITCTLHDGKVVDKKVDGQLVSVSDLEVSPAFMERFDRQYKEVESFVSKKIGTFTESITTRPAYFGPSAFIDLIHTLQLELTGADISLAAPLSFDAQIAKGDIYVSDMFNLYRFENMLYTMSLTGREILGALEMSYDNWINVMKSPSDHVLRVREPQREGDRIQFIEPSYNFDSAAGIIYTVDVRKPRGQKVSIVSMADGTPFSLDKTYKVAVNSYRGNGGGSQLIDGAGIPSDQLQDRVIQSTDVDLRYYLMKYIEEHHTISPRALGQWKLVPEKWVAPAIKRDYKLLFGEEML